MPVVRGMLYTSGGHTLHIPLATASIQQPADGIRDTFCTKLCMLSALQVTQVPIWHQVLDM